MVAAAKRNSCAALAARALAAFVAVLTTSLPAPCQAQTVPALAPDDVSFLLGRVTLFPAFTLRDTGYDSNVFNDPDNPKGDFTLTAQPRLRATVPAAGGILSGGAAIGLVYYATYKDQQSLNRFFEGRYERAASRLRPFVAGTFNYARDRYGPEIDARVAHRETSASAGAELKLTGITSLTGLYRYSTQDYGDDEEFLGSVLGDQLNRVTDLASAGLRYYITPITTLVVDFEVQRDRFETSPIRDSDSWRVMPAAEFGGGGVLTGRVAAGFRKFEPRDALVAPFDGLVAAANVAYTLLGRTRFTVEGTRDVMYSFDVATPYYLLDSGRITVSQPIGGPIDLIGVASADRLRYQALEGLPDPHRVTRTTTFGGGMGFRVGQTVRLGLIYEQTKRSSSDIEQRDYRRHRIFGSVTYGR